MSKKPAEPDEMRMPAEKFDEVMRRALSAPPPQAPKSSVRKTKATAEKTIKGSRS